MRNRLGFAVQWGTVRMLGTFLGENPTAVPSGVVAFVCEQLGIALRSTPAQKRPDRPARHESGRRCGSDVLERLEQLSGVAVSFQQLHASGGKVAAILARADRLATPAERALASQAMVMGLFAGQPRAELAALGHPLFGDGRLVREDGAESHALWHVIGTLSWCDEAEAVLAMLARGPAPEPAFAGWQHAARGRLAAYRGEHARALEAFQATGQRASELLLTNPTVIPWRSEAGLAALQLGRHDEARELIETGLCSPSASAARAPSAPPAARPVCSPVRDEWSVELDAAGALRAEAGHGQCKR